MHEGDHEIIDSTSKEFDEKFGCSDCESTYQVQNQHHKAHGDDHQHHDHGHNHSHPHPHASNPVKSNKTVEIVSGVIVGVLILGFILWKFFMK